MGFLLFFFFVSWGIATNSITVQTLDRELVLHAIHSIIGGGIFSVTSKNTSKIADSFADANINIKHYLLGTFNLPS